MYLSAYSKKCPVFLLNGCRNICSSHRLLNYLFLQILTVFATSPQFYRYSLLQAEQNLLYIQLLQKMFFLVLAQKY